MACAEGGQALPVPDLLRGDRHRRGGGGQVAAHAQLVPQQVGHLVGDPAQVQQVADPAGGLDARLRRGDHAREPVRSVRGGHQRLRHGPVGVVDEQRRVHQGGVLGGELARLLEVDDAEALLLRLADVLDPAADNQHALFGHDAPCTP